MNKLTEYLENRIQLLKLESISATAKISAKLVSSVLALAVLLLIVLLFSLAISFAIGEYLGSIAVGFGIVGGVYLVLFVIYMLSFKTKLEYAVKNTIVALTQESFDESEIK